MKQGIMKKVTALALSVAMITVMGACGKQDGISGSNDVLMNAFATLSSKAEISFVQTSMDDMGTRNEGVKEISFVYQQKDGETMLNGDMD